MTPVLQNYDIPIAYAMIASAKRVRPRRDGQHTAQKYYFLWTAFENIYDFLAVQEGHTTQLKYSQDGSIVTRSNGSVRIPEVNEIDVQEKLSVVVSVFDEHISDQLIFHESTHHFTKRIPYYQGKKLAQDAFNQRLNGVLNIRLTTDSDYPVWSPIDIKLFSEYINNPTDEATRIFLVQQIIELLHTVRGNMMLGGKQFHDATDQSVIKHALPLLELIVMHFTRTK